MTLTAEETWNSCLNQLAEELAPQIYKTWFEPIKPMSLQRDETGYRLRLGVPSRFFYEWLESRFNTILTSTVDRVTGTSTEISFLIDSDLAEVDTPPSSAAAGGFVKNGLSARASGYHEAPRRGAVEATTADRSSFRFPLTYSATPFAPAPATPLHAPVRPAPRSTPELNRLYTFDRFIEGDSNRLARSAALAIAERPGETSFNPFLVYGGVGLGKTHLIQAIGNYAMSRGFDSPILYISSERFTSMFVQAIQQNRIAEFARRFREVRMLIMDDIQFFGGKEKTQEEFFHIFNELHQKRCQIVLSCDRAPKDIVGIEERLLSRFHWGLVADIQPPDLETRIAILRRKAQAEGVTLETGVAEFVAERIKTNIRKLEGALIRLTAHASLQSNTRIDLPFARDVLHDLLDEKPARLDIEEIKRQVAHYYNVAVDLLSAKTRRREIVQARHLAMYFCKKLTEQPLKTIGLRFGGRDHSTVIHACKAVEDRFDTDLAFRKELEEVQVRLESHLSAR
jgi:chromosomal replication initiator protein